MRNATLALLALLTVLTGCSGQPVEPSYYLLRPSTDVASRALTPSPHFALGRVAIAPYLDQRGLLLETSAGEMRSARQHLWAEPMYEGIRAFLMAEISRFNGEDILPAKLNPRAITIDIRVDQLHGTYDGNARLVAYWWLRQGGNVTASYQFAEGLRLSRDGYNALASAEKALLTNLASRIAETLVPPVH